jgi:uncharacterized membrane protein YesL
MSKKDIKENKKNYKIQWKDYLWANLIFLGFLILLTFVVWQSSSSPTDDQHITAVLKQTFKFMVFLFGGGFVVLTLFDAAYDFFSSRAGEEPGSEVNSGEKNSD